MKKEVVFALLGLTLFAGGFALFLRGDIENYIEGRKQYKLGLQALRHNQWEAAISSLLEALRHQPESAPTQKMLAEARGNYLDAEKAKIKSEHPLDALPALQQLAKRAGTLLDQAGMNEILAWRNDLEPAALSEVATGFDADMESVDAKFQNREDSFVGLFSPGAQPQARDLLSAWQSLRRADAAWQTNRPELVETAIAQIPPALQRKLYDHQRLKLESLRQKVAAQVEAARALVAREDYVGAQAIYVELQSYEAWMPELPAERLSAQALGEGYYVNKLVATALARNSEQADNWFQKFLMMRGRGAGATNTLQLFRARTTADFLRVLADIGLHTENTRERKTFTDTILVAANLENFSDQVAARKFLGDSYQEWAAQELAADHPEGACYLALLAQKHGQKSAGALFDKARSQIMDKFTVGLVTTPLQPAPQWANQAFADDLYADAVGLIRKDMPGFVKFLGESGASTSSPTMFQVRLSAGLRALTSKYERNSREVSKAYPVQFLVDNPQYDTLVSEVEGAEQSVEKAADHYQELQEQASANEQALASMNNPFAGLGSSIDHTANQVILSTVQREINEAKAELRRAKSKLQHTPRQITNTEDRNFFWTETDHLTRYQASFQTSLTLNYKPLYSKAFDASAVHKSVERAGDPRLGLKPRQRHSPDLGRIEGILSADLKRRFREIPVPDIMRQIKAAITQTITGKTPGHAADTREDRALAAEMVWWDTPLRDSRILGDTAFRGRFGDLASDSVIPAASLTAAPPSSAGRRVSATSTDGLAGLLLPASMTDPAPTQASAVAPPSDSLPPAARRKLDALQLILQDVDHATKAEDRVRFLREFLDKSRDYTQAYPIDLGILVQQALVALELKAQPEGHSIGRQLIQVGAGHSADEKIVQLMARLERMGWLPEKKVGE